VNAEKIAHKFDTVNDTNQGRQSEVLVERPNGLAFSRRERAERQLQKRHDLARKAVGCNGGLGRCSGILCIRTR
jgi:hypothetical protein